MLDARSKYLRNLVIDGLEGGQRGHVGSALSLVEILRVLYDSVMTYDPRNAKWPARDRLILSKGHGCLALYSLLADKGFISKEELGGFCGMSSRLGGHPEYGQIPGVEASTGSLGHGLPVGVGMAYAARIRDDGHRIFVILGDGELAEGSNWEAALAASHHSLNNLTVIVDVNGQQSYGTTSQVWSLESLREKWEAFGFKASEADGHDVEQLRTHLNWQDVSQPNVVLA